MNLKAPPSIKVNITKGDLLVCSCGAEAWNQTFQIGKTKNPMIGGSPPHLYVGVQVLGFTCAICGQDAKDAKNKVKREIEAELKANEKPIEPTDPEMN